MVRQRLRRPHGPVTWGSIIAALLLLAWSFLHTHRNRPTKAKAIHSELRQDLLIKTAAAGGRRAASETLGGSRAAEAAAGKPAIASSRSSSASGGGKDGIDGGSSKAGDAKGAAALQLVGGGKADTVSAPAQQPVAGIPVAALEQATSKLSRSNGSVGPGLASSSSSGGSSGGGSRQATAPTKASQAGGAGSSGAAKGDKAPTQQPNAAVAGEVQRKAPRLEQSNYVGLCLIVKDEHFRIREWAAYHTSLGAKLFVYDEGSQPPMRDTLADFIALGLVHYRHLKNPLGHRGSFEQLAVYDDCMRSHGKEVTWLGAIDTDEFIVIMDGSPSLPDVLRRYEACGGLVVNWRLYGTSGHQEKTPGLVLEEFTACSPGPNSHVKSFVQAKRTLRAGWSPHHFDYKPGFFAVNTNLTKVEGPWSDPPVADVLVVNHYVTRSAQEYAEKLQKGNGMNQPKDMAFFKAIEKETSAKCDYAVPLGAKVREQLAKVEAAAAAKAGVAAQPTRTAAVPAAAVAQQ